MKTITFYIFHIIGILLHKNNIIDLNINIHIFIIIFQNILLHIKFNKNNFIKSQNKIK